MIRSIIALFLLIRGYVSKWLARKENIVADPNPIDPTFPPITPPDFGTQSDDDGGGSGQTTPPRPPKPPKPIE